MTMVDMVVEALVEGNMILRPRVEDGKDCRAAQLAGEARDFLVVLGAIDEWVRIVLIMLRVFPDIWYGMEQGSWVDDLVDALHGPLGFCCWISG